MKVRPIILTNYYYETRLKKFVSYIFIYFNDDWKTSSKTPYIEIYELTNNLFGNIYINDTIIFQAKIGKKCIEDVCKDLIKHLNEYSYFYDFVKNNRN